jgi:FkbM family methyltransferase
MQDMTQPQTVFDQSHYLRLIETRGETIRHVVSELQPLLDLSTAVDAGCGVGFFAQVLQKQGFEVRGFDGRRENILEARNRYPGISFEQGDIEDKEILKLGVFDFVLCFGLLYHLESTLRSIRNLRSLAGKALLLESMCFPDQEPRMLLREEQSIEDQSLTDLAFYPTEGCLVKMLYRAGFQAVYRVAALPDHDDFRDTHEHIRRRTVLLATFSPILSDSFMRLAEPVESSDPWAIPVKPKRIGRRVKTFLKKPFRRKLESVTFRARKFLPHKPVSILLPFGATWLPEDSALDSSLGKGEFENAETHFVDRFLQPGMTVLDVGAHHGLYTLLSSIRVGTDGRVVAFEPSPRERERLKRHIQSNGCRNVQVIPTALSSSSGKSSFFLVEGASDYCNSLRPPAVQAKTRQVEVEVTTLDEFLAKTSMNAVDFVKLDVEGAELDVLKGATKLLRSNTRPILLVEVYDIRTEPWQYRACEIVQFLNALGYRWFSLTEDGLPHPIAEDQTKYDANLIAVPKEKIEKFIETMAGQGNYQEFQRHV